MDEIKNSQRLKTNIQIETKPKDNFILQNLQFNYDSLQKLIELMKNENS